MQQKKFLVSTAIDYVNDVIHIGHAYEKILADVYVRHLRGVHGKENVHFLTGTDEHGQKVQKSAGERGISPKQFADEISAADQSEIMSLNVSFDRFIRTTDEDHIKVVEQFWKKVKDAGYIYEGEFTGLYCEGDEAFLTESELVDAKCPNHPTIPLKKVTEKNYFFKWSAFQTFLEKLFEDHPDFVPQDIRRNEMLKFLAQGLEDLTISRSKDTVSWGIEVPDDSNQVIYVWFDALINYLTYGLEKKIWDKETTIIHFVGKDILRWHSLLWPAMLKAAGYKVPDVVIAHGFLGLNGQKISKSIGNIIRPSELVEKYGVDPVRYYLSRYTRLDADADLDLNHFEEVYNADLANGLGNLIARVAKLCETGQYENAHQVPRYADVVSRYDNVQQAIETVNYPQALQTIWQAITDIDVDINDTQPWVLIKNEELAQANEVLDRYVGRILDITTLLIPFLPLTSEKILSQFSQKQIKAEKQLFPRLT